MVICTQQYQYHTLLTERTQSELNGGSLWALLLTPGIIRTAFFCKRNTLLMYVDVEPIGGHSKAAFTLYATRLGRMIGFQWNQLDRSHYARRDGTRLRRPNWLLYPNNRTESRSKRDSLGFRHQRNPIPRIVTRLTHVAYRVDTSRVDNSANFNQYPPVWRIRISRNVFVWLRNAYGCNFWGNVSQVNTMSSWIKTPIKIT